MPRQQVAVDLALREPVHAREGDQVGVRADGVERVELDAAQVGEQGANARGALLRLRSVQRELAEQVGARLVAREHDGLGARASRLALGGEGS
ncbi:MAG: hypothetical protein ACOX6T_14590 [Myxococcales bacterium]